MKTNGSARRIRKLRLIIQCVAMVVLAGAAFPLGQSLATRFSQAKVTHTETVQVPNFDLSVLLARQ